LGIAEQGVFRGDGSHVASPGGDAMPDSSSPLVPVSPMLLGMFAALVSALAAQVQRGSEHNAWEGTCEARERCQEWASLTRDL
jgi:hypothetical protein